MKSNTLAAMLLTATAVSAFSPATSFVPRTAAGVSTMSRNMFSGSGEAAPKEDDTARIEAMEAAAKSMGMSLEEYQIGMQARVRFESEIDALRLTGGDADIGIEQDGRGPPIHLEITITEDGKAKGKDVVENELVAAFSAASEKAKEGRAAAQKNMMGWIAEEMK